ncbi:LAME_0G10924g1_1 [Lachancea meyersii CBS 8951]|uniref:RNA exonuclease 4 n=1 Tax=Lachancea meyersii CBS 8951 TaxID=1266667 RepID=A0A1G4K960_9SACH|nr:LAME_0G10924g1_1 [Lachancea meyersii CBS 8951]
MVLSSNWLKLQSSQTDTKSQKSASKPVKATGSTHRVEKTRKIVNTNKPKGPAGVRETTKARKGKDMVPHVRSKKNIMKMVDSMTEEIAKLEGQKARLGNSNGPASSLAASLEQSLQADAQDRNSQRAAEVGKYVALDCEFVGVGPDGKESALARATLVNFFGHVVLDVFVKPREKVTDWRTWVSGVRPQDMQNAVPFPVAQEQVAKTLQNRTLVGHAVAHDLQALFLSHPRSMIRDTSRHIPFRKKYAGGKTPSLKKLAKEVLGLDIQGAEHSPIEDARATMLIYKADRKEFERLHQIKFGSN